MPGRAQAVSSGKDLEDRIAYLGKNLGLIVQRQVNVGKRLWGAKRQIDVILTHPDTRQRIGLECKYQGGPGSADEKIPLTVQDIMSWPMRGLVIFDGPGLSDHMRGYLLSTGMAVELEDLEIWLRLYFGLELGETYIDQPSLWETNR